MPNPDRPAGAKSPPERSIDERFAAINRERLRRINQRLSTRQHEFLTLLPLLFHTNHALLPGYVTQTTPAGIRGYAPGSETLAAAHRLTKSFRYNSREQRRRLDVLGLYLMGSTGTIAHSAKSDFDLWLCHPSGLSDEAIAELREKSHRLEAHGNDLGLDVHFFVFDPDSFRRGELTSLSAESSGSSQHYLLLDEFYRSAVVVAGLIPAWWQVPPEEEQRYDDFVINLKTKRFAGQRDTIDFGGIASIPAEEFFGAAIWHLYKSIDSPYKSLLKLLLIEAYTDEFPRIDLLAMRYKRAVYSGTTDFAELDPYLQMYRKVEEYLMARNEPARLALLRRAFYLKVNDKLSQPARDGGGWRRETMELLARQWGWDSGQFALLDSHDTWKLPEVIEERRALIAALTQSYRALSQFARRSSGNFRITQQDLHILGRKLYAAFERKAGKVEIVNRGIVPNVAESRVSLHRLTAANDTAGWALFAGAVDAEEIGSFTPLKRSGSLIEMAAWCWFNGVIADQTIVQLHAGGADLSLRDWRAATEALKAVFPGAGLGDATTDDLIRRPLLRGAVLFVNVESVANPVKSRGDGIIATNRTDALSFGALHENLIRSFDLVYATSWQEVFTARYHGTGGLLECLADLIRLLPDADTGVVTVPPVGVHCFSSAYASSITRRLSALIGEAGARMTFRDGKAVRMILEIEDVFHVIERPGDQPAYKSVGRYQELVGYLGDPLPRHTVTCFDANTLAGRVLPALYRHDRPDVIKVFFRPEGRKAEMFVLDERGSLYMQNMPFNHPPALVNHLHRFFSTMLERVRLLGPRAADQVADIRIDFKLIASDSEGNYRLEPLLYDPDQSQNYKQLKVILEQAESGDGQDRYSILCGDREFSSLEHGADVFTAAARYIIEMRRSGLTYPIYITDVDLTQSGLLGQDMEVWQTVQFLKIKKTVEERFADALRRL